MLFRSVFRVREEASEDLLRGPAGSVARTMTGETAQHMVKNASDVRDETITRTCAQPPHGHQVDAEAAEVEHRGDSNVAREETGHGDHHRVLAEAVRATPTVDVGESLSAPVHLADMAGEAERRLTRFI